MYPISCIHPHPYSCSERYYDIKNHLWRRVCFVSVFVIQRKPWLGKMGVSRNFQISIEFIASLLSNCFYRCTNNIQANPIAIVAVIIGYIKNTWNHFQHYIFFLHDDQLSNA